MTETGETMGVDADVEKELNVRRTFTCSLCKTVGHRKNAASCPMRQQSTDLAVTDMGNAYLHREPNGSTYWSLKDD
ncbi:hypothetical protein AQUCO_00300080v1 [Aquilegia coerulea]|nr:hypothetical protein AQUCO_04700054v1 [Aquilegia coerulea]PIA34088.1 hypothetical protein AQUCO_03900176v1 [Aquilegia coerulea]PIA60331.1 hypothetical protein AQUCO_00300080v1 [Aquilegia coerulea]